MKKAYLLRTLCGAMMIMLVFANSGLAQEKEKAEQVVKPAPAIESQYLTPEQQYDYYFRLADKNLGEFSFEESIQYCEKALKYKPGDYLVRAIICLNYYELGEQLKVQIPEQKKEKAKLYLKMEEIAEQGIKHAPGKGECYFFRGLARARLSTTNGIIYSLFMAKGIEKDWLFAKECKSEYVTPNGENLHASAHVALGSYYRLCPSFFLLALIFGINGDIDKSVEYCRLAHEMDTRIEITKEYGVSLITRGLWQKKDEDIAAGKALLKQVPTMTLRLRTDPVDIEHSKMLLNDIKLCPEYSRDQQQETSEKKFREHQRMKEQQAKTHLIDNK